MKKEIAKNLLSCDIALRNISNSLNSLRSLYLKSDKEQKINIEKEQIEKEQQFILEKLNNIELMVNLNKHNKKD